jgi:hypothetical protein
LAATAGTSHHLIFIMPALQPIEKQISELLQNGCSLTVSWHCGGDESFVETALDGQQQEFNYADANDLATLMDRYLTDLLELPDVGEFDMDGNGRIFCDGKEVVIEYQSVANTYWDENWKDEFTDEELLAMGVELPERQAPENPTSTSESTSDTPDETNDTYDPDMSAEYSGRRVLFLLE